MHTNGELLLLLLVVSHSLLLLFLHYDFFFFPPLAAFSPCSCLFLPRLWFPDLLSLFAFSLFCHSSSVSLWFLCMPELMRAAARQPQTLPCTTAASQQQDTAPVPGIQEGMAPLPRQLFLLAAKEAKKCWKGVQKLCMFSSHPIGSCEHYLMRRI